MKKRGITLIELIAALAFFMVIVSITFDVYNKNIKYYSDLGTSIDERANSRIALDFTAGHLRGAQIIGTASDSVSIDGHKIYLKNNILRYDYDSVQIANNITGFEVRALNSYLFRVTISAGDYSTTAIINTRG